MKTYPAKIKRRKFFDRAGNFMLAVIPIIGFLLFGLVPMLLSVYMSFTDLKLPIITEGEWVAFDNYITLFKDPEFYKAFLHTFEYLLTVPLSMIIGLLIAQMLNRINVCKRFFRSAFFIPFVCSVVAVSVAFRSMYEFNYGILNTILQFFGLDKIGWVTDSKWFMISAIIMGTWSGTGICVILYQAALANINQSYYEAARIEGASESQIFFKITLPAISPTTFYLLVMKLISALQVMGEIQVLAGDGMGPERAGNTVVLYLYYMMQVYPQSYGYGMASALAWILAIVILLITRINFKLGEKWVCYDFN
jgi:multiple sugar transport system permease protein